MRKTIDKVVFIVESTFSTRDYNRFGVDVLIKNGFEVEVLDLTPYLKTEFYKTTSIPDPVKYNGYKSINNKKELYFELSNYRNNSFIISLITYRPETYCIYRTISKYNIRYGLISVAVPYDVANTSTIPISIFKKIINRIVNLSFSRVSSYLINYLPNNMLGICSAKYVFAGGAYSPTKMKLIGKDSKIVWIHSLDYDNYLASQSLKSTRKRNYAVFLDQNLPFHTDFARQGKINPFEIGLYYSELIKAFDAIEKALDLDIIIAAHPRANMEVLSQYFGNRDVIANETVNIVRDAALCITHWSYSINFAILYKKPIIFLTSSTIKNSDHEWLIDSYSSCLDIAPIDMSSDIDLDRDNVLSISKDKYEKYKQLYIKTDNSAQIKFWDAVSLTLLNKSIK
jgi:hypothetical protein